MKTNTKAKLPAVTHEKAPTVTSAPAQELRRAVMSCLLWENNFYESGEDIVLRIRSLVKKVPADQVAEIAIEARSKFNLRHVPLLLARELARGQGNVVGRTISEVIQRPDELTEFLSLYWKDKKQPLSKQVKLGLAHAFTKFNAYQLAKYNQLDKAVKLRDVLFLSHAKPKDEAQAEVWKKLIAGTLESPDTWEVALSGGADKKATFERLIAEKKLGGMALLRNLRKMTEVGVDDNIIWHALAAMNTERILPFRFISAAKYAPRFEPVLEQSMFRAIAEQPKLPGNTALLIDHSGSMQMQVSEKSEISRFDAAAALAMVLRETADQCRVFTFSDRCIEVPPRRGFGLLAAVKEVVNPVGTMLGAAVRHIYKVWPACERIIVITDEQSADRPPHPQGHGYIVNVAGYKNGIAYGPWVQINGWSEAILTYIRESEVG